MVRGFKVKLHIFSLPIEEFTDDKRFILFSQQPNTMEGKCTFVLLLFCVVAVMAVPNYENDGKTFYPFCPAFKKASCFKKCVFE